MSCALPQSRCQCWDEHSTDSFISRPGDLDRYTAAQVAWIRSSSTTYRVCTDTIKRWVTWGRNWNCQICGADISGPKQACLDHDHTTGHARGVICRNCNLGLGYLDRPSWFDKAITYLARHDDDVVRRLQRTAPKPISLLAPVTQRQCTQRVLDMRPCSMNALPFLSEAAFCRVHASAAQRAANSEREGQWRALAEGLYWSVQKVWATPEVASDEDAA